MVQPGTHAVGSPPALTPRVALTIPAPPPRGLGRTGQFQRQGTAGYLVRLQRFVMGPVRVFPVTDREFAREAARLLGETTDPVHLEELLRASYPAARVVAQNDMARMSGQVLYIYRDGHAAPIESALQDD